MHTLSLGKHNARIVALRKAVKRGELSPEGLLPIEGPKLLEEALRSGIPILDVFLRRGVDIPPVSESTVVYELDEAAFKSIQATETSQGIVALVRPPAFTFEEILKTPNPLLVLLGRVQDPGNVGTILRIAESFFANGCLALSGTASIHNNKVVRASAGSVFRLPQAWNLDLHQVRGRLSALGIQMVGTSPTAGHSISEFDWRQPVAIFIGNEGGGMSAAEITACDTILRIPQNPAVESLNSAIATAIILYEASKTHERIII